MKNNLLVLTNKKYFWGILLLFTIVYVKGLFSFIYGVDSSIYAAISAEMKDTNNWLELYLNGKDYLDKPPLHFWLCASSFKIFGVNSFAYKLPSFLITILGAFSTFKLGKLLYSKEIGKLSALFYYTCFAFILINVDVRTDTILVGIIVFTMWQLIAFLNTNNYWNFTLGFIGIGLAMLAKGPIGLMVPVLSLGIHFIMKKQWANIFKWQWLLGLVITSIVISPMVWGLYHQFDLQPNKSFALASGMDGTGTSGLKFYFWDQSFGRITGGNKEWKNNASIYFFTHTFLWSFLPWSLFGVLALFKKIRVSFHNIRKNEFYTLGAILLPFVAFSISQYQLPHYIYVFFPFWIILTSWYFINLSPNSVFYKISKIIHYLLNFIFIAISIITLTYIFPTKSLFIWTPLILLLIGLSITYIKTKGKEMLINSTLIGYLCLVFVFNFHFIPRTIEYDGNYQATLYSKKLNINRLLTNEIDGLTFDIYSNTTSEEINLDSLSNYINKNNYVYTKEANLERVKKQCEIKSIHKFSHFCATALTSDFLNPETREDTFEYFYLIEI